MKSLNKKTARTLLLAMIMVMGAVAFAFADTNPFMSVAKPVIELLNSLLTPLMLIVGAAGSLYCILLGVKYARAEEPQDREKAKQHLKSAIIGFVLIFVLIVVLNLLMTPMMTWVQNSTNNEVTFDVSSTTTQSAGSSSGTSSGTTSGGTSSTPVAPVEQPQ